MEGLSVVFLQVETMEPREAKRSRRGSEESSRGAGDGSAPASRLILEAAPKTQAEALSAAKQLHRLGTSIPPLMEQGVLGDVQVRVKWWGEEGPGVELEPRMTSHTTFLSKEPLSRANCCIFPVRVDSEHFSAYLEDMHHLTLEILDGVTGAVVGKCFCSLTERTTKIRRVPIYLLEKEGGEGAGQEGEEKQKGGAEGGGGGATTRPKGPCIGDLFVQVLVRMGAQSCLRRVVAALVQDQGAGLIQAVNKSLHPDDSPVLHGLVAGILGQPPDGHLLEQLNSSPPAEDRDAQKDALWSFQLDEAMAHADAQDQLPTWPQQAHKTLYTAPESQGIALQPGTLTYQQLQRQQHAVSMMALLPPRNEAGQQAASTLLPSPEPSPGGLARLAAPVPSPALGPPPPPPASTRHDRRHQQPSGPRGGGMVAGREEPVQEEEGEGEVYALGGGAARQQPRGGARASSLVRSEEGGEEEEEGQEDLIESLLARGRQLRDVMRAATGGPAGVVGGAGRMAGGGRRRPQTGPDLSFRGIAAILGANLDENEEEDDTVGLTGGAAAAGLPLEYGRVANDAIWPMLEGSADGVDGSDEEDDLVRSLLQGGDKKAFEVQSKYPAMAAAERLRLEYLEKARFMIIALPGLSLLQAFKPPKRITVRYTLPQHAMAPPNVPDSRVIDCPFSSCDPRDRRMGQPHPGSYSPERPTTKTPLCLAVEVTDGVLNAWLNQSLEFLVLVSHSQLSNLDYQRKIKPGTKSGKRLRPDALVVIARAQVPLRDLVLSPYLSIATTLELVREEREPLTATWKTAEGIGGRTILGTLNVEMSLVSPDLARVESAPHGPERTARAISQTSSLPRFGPPSKVMQGPVNQALPPTGSAFGDAGGAAGAGGQSAPQLFVHLGRLRLKHSFRQQTGGCILRYWDLASTFSGGQNRARHELRSRGHLPDFNHSLSLTLPPAIDTELLASLHAQYLIIEVWAGSSGNKGSSAAPRLLGLVKVALAPLADSLEERSRTASKGEGALLPGLPVHGWSDIVNPFSGERVGQLQVTMAVGSGEQVERVAAVTRPLERLQARVRGVLTRKRRRVRRTARLGAILSQRGSLGGGGGGGGGGGSHAASVRADQGARRVALDHHQRLGVQQQVRSTTPGRSRQVNGDEGAGGAAVDEEEDQEEVDGSEFEVSGPSVGDSTVLSGLSRESERIVKHVVDFRMEGTCPLGASWASGAGPASTATSEGSSIEQPSCYVRYFVPVNPNAMVRGEAALARNDEMLDAQGPRKGAKGLEKSICLWWDLDHSDTNSRARHVLHVPPGQRVEDLLCGQEDGIHFEVWLAGLEGSEPGRHLIGTAVLPRRALARLTEEELASRTFRLELSRDGTVQDGHDLAPDLQYVDVTLSYHREPWSVSRASRRSFSPLDGGGSLLYGEHTTVDRLLPAKSHLCVEILAGTVLPNGIIGNVRRAAAAHPGVDTKHVLIDYHLRTAKDAPPCRHFVRLDDAPPTLRDEVPIAISESVVNYLYNDTLEVRLLTEGADHGGDVIAIARVPLSSLLTSMGGVYGVYAWEDRDGRALGGQVRVAVYFKHRQHLSGAAAPYQGRGRTERTVAEQGGGGGAVNHGPARASEEQRHHATHVDAFTGSAASRSEATQPSFSSTAEPSPHLAAVPSPFPVMVSAPTDMPTSSPSAFSSRAPPPPQDSSLPGPCLTVRVEEAKHLRLPPSCLERPHASQLLLSYEWNREVISTNPVPASPAPIWDHYCRLALPKTRMLHDASLTLELWERPASIIPIRYTGMEDWKGQSSGGGSTSLQASKGLRLGDSLLGRAVVDLSALAAGLKELHGWYHVTDGLQRLKGQVKIKVRLLAEGQEEEEEEGDNDMRLPEELIEWGSPGGGEQEEASSQTEGGQPQGDDDKEGGMADFEALESLRESVTELPGSAPRTPSRVCWHSLSFRSVEEREGGGESPSRAGLDAIHAIMEGLEGLNQELMAPYSAQRQQQTTQQAQQQQQQQQQQGGDVPENEMSAEASGLSVTWSQGGGEEQKQEEEGSQEEDGGWVMMDGAVEGGQEEDLAMHLEAALREEELRAARREAVERERQQEEDLTVPRPEDKEHAADSKIEAAAPAVATTEEAGGEGEVPPLPTTVREIAIQTEEEEEEEAVHGVSQSMDAGHNEEEEEEEYDDDAEEEEEEEDSVDFEVHVRPDGGFRLAFPDSPALEVQAEEEEDVPHEYSVSTPSTSPQLSSVSSTSPTGRAAAAPAGHDVASASTAMQGLARAGQEEDVGSGYEPEREDDEDDVYEDDFDAEDPLSPVRRRPRQAVTPSLSSPSLSVALERGAPVFPISQQQGVQEQAEEDVDGEKDKEGEQPSPPRRTPPGGTPTSDGGDTGAVASSTWAYSALPLARPRPSPMGGGAGSTSHTSSFSSEPSDGDGVSSSHGGSAEKSGADSGWDAGDGLAGPANPPRAPSSHSRLLGPSTVASSWSSTTSAPTRPRGSRARFADSETERIARIMMGKFGGLSGSGASYSWSTSPGQAGPPPEEEEEEEEK